MQRNATQRDVMRTTPTWRRLLKLIAIHRSSSRTRTILVGRNESRPHDWRRLVSRALK